jgi:hypothetical protein
LAFLLGLGCESVLKKCSIIFLMRTTELRTSGRRLGPLAGTAKTRCPPEEADERFSAAVNGVLADTFALYVKTKNFHWHVTGPHFRDYHLLLDEQAERRPLRHVAGADGRHKGQIKNMRNATGLRKIMKMRRLRASSKFSSRRRRNAAGSCSRRAVGRIDKARTEGDRWPKLHPVLSPDVRNIAPSADHGCLADT